MKLPPDNEHNRHEGNGKSPVIARWISNLLAALMTVAIIGGVCWWNGNRFGFLTTRPRPPQRQATADSTDETTGEDRSTNPTRQPSVANGNSQTHDDENHTDSKTTDKTEIDFTQTSWQNPFTAAHWESDGWTFHGDSMLSSSAETTSATFRRRYRKLSIECRVTRVGKPGAFEICLFAPATNAQMTAKFTAEGVVLFAKIEDRKRIIKRRKTKLPFAVGKPLNIRLSATGNRVLIVCNGRVVISGNQPAEQSGKSLKLSLRTNAGQFRISRLRLEGD